MQAFTVTDLGGGAFAATGTATAGNLPAVAVIENQPGGVQGSLNATIAPGGVPVSLSSADALFAFRGVAVPDTVDGSIPGGYVNGPILAVTNSANLTLADPSFASNAAILAVSAGAPGYAQKKDGAQAAIYNAGFGGAITLTNAGALTVNGSTGATGSGQP